MRGPQQLRQPVHAGCGDTEHGDADRRFVRGHGGGRGRHHAGDRMRRIGKHDARDAVEPGEIGHRIHHRDVAGPDIGSDVARSDGRDHELRHADGQRPHSRCHEGRAAGSAETDDARHVIDAEQKGLQSHGHAGDRTAAIAGEDRVEARRMMRRDGGRRDIRCHPMVQTCRHIHQPDGETPIGDQPPNIGEFRALGVACTHDIDAPHHHLPSAGSADRLRQPEPVIEQHHMLQPAADEHC